MANSHELRLVETLKDLLYGEVDADDVLRVDESRTFEEAGLLTMNTGLVLRDRDGHEFQLQVVQSA